MIDGIKLHLSSAQLLHIITDRRNDHAAKAKRYDARAREMKEVGDNPETRVSNDKSTIEAFERRVQEHLNKTREFQFMADYLPPGETFELGWDDLRRLEVITSTNY